MAVRTCTGLVIWAVAVCRASCVQVPDLLAFFTSPNGLAMSYSDASSTANGEVQYLTDCRITVADLQALRDAMYLPSALNLDLATVRAKLLPLAYQHVVPADLNALYQTLRNRLQMSSSLAQWNAMSLATQHAQPSQPQPLFDVLRNVVWLSVSQAQQTAMTYAAAGTDSGTLSSVYQSSKRQGMSQDAALSTALAAAVAANLYGLPGRYAKDGQLYLAKDFQSYYRNQWFAEWQAAPEEKRTALDGKDYRASEFAEFFGSNWNTQWAASPVAEQRRIDIDGNTYTLALFQHYFGDTWQAKWAQAYEVLDVCAGLSQSACSAVRVCQWYWSGDWTTSCVVRPRTEELVV